jgi:hypothetical protein
VEFEDLTVTIRDGITYFVAGYTQDVSTASIDQGLDE